MWHIIVSIIVFFYESNSMIAHMLCHQSIEMFSVVSGISKVLLIIFGLLLFIAIQVALHKGIVLLPLW